MTAMRVFKPLRSPKEGEVLVKFALTAILPVGLADRLPRFAALNQEQANSLVTAIVSSLSHQGGGMVGPREPVGTRSASLVWSAEELTEETAGGCG
jgi:hypothetical protein